MRSLNALNVYFSHSYVLEPRDMYECRSVDNSIRNAPTRAMHNHAKSYHQIFKTSPV